MVPLTVLNPASDQEKSAHLKRLESEHRDETSIRSRQNHSNAASEIAERKKKDHDIKVLQEEMSVLRCNLDRVTSDKSKITEELTRHRALASLVKTTPSKIKPGIGTFDPAITGNVGQSPARIPVRSTTGTPAARDDRAIRDAQAKIASLETDNEALKAVVKRMAADSNNIGTVPIVSNAEGRIADLTKRNADLLAISRSTTEKTKMLQTQSKEFDSQMRALQEELRLARVEAARRQMPAVVKPAASSSQLASLNDQIKQYAIQVATLQDQALTKNQQVLRSHVTFKYIVVTPQRYSIGVTPWFRLFFYPHYSWMR